MAVKEKPKAKIGRPVEPVPQDVADDIVDWITSGKTLRAWCREPGNLSWNTVYSYVAKDPAFASRFAQAREAGCDAIAEETLEIIDTEPEMATGPGGGFSRDGSFVKWKQNQAELRLKLLAKWNPKKYGDKIDLTSKGERLNINISVDDEKL